jgi:hypothetical protein
MPWAKESSALAMMRKPVALLVTRAGRSIMLAVDRRLLKTVYTAGSWAGICVEQLIRISGLLSPFRSPALLTANPQPVPKPPTSFTPCGCVRLLRGTDVAWG